MSSSNKPTDVGTAPLSGEAPLFGSGARLENKDAEKNVVNLSNSVDPTAATTGDDATTQPPSGPGIVAQSHPGQIIPHHEKNTSRNPYYGGVLNEVNVLVAREAEKIMQAMSTMVENWAYVGGGSADIPLNVRDALYPHSGSTAELGFPKKTGLRTGLVAWSTSPNEPAITAFRSAPHEGKIHDTPDPAFVIPRIEAFIQAYDLKVDDLLEPDIKKYKTFNDFFKCSLKPGARPVQEANDLGVITSRADSRVTVFKSVGDAKKIKGQEFTLPTLLDDNYLAETFTVAIFQFAPQDYHRYHAPFKAKLGKMFHVPGTYFTVKSNSSTRMSGTPLSPRPPRPPPRITHLNKPPPELGTFALVAVGALLVGSIGWSKNPGDSEQKGGDLGFFQYSGSTMILVAPEGTIEWDEDLVANSSGLTGLTGVESGRPVETLVRVGERIGKVVQLVG
ncbi:hypothetical protein FRC05_010273 [Tulasnella sp. 425]|nr:hypothetical protein FRC05_010273 [Tulasnella sp. 425]